LLHRGPNNRIFTASVIVLFLLRRNARPALVPVSVLALRVLVVMFYRLRFAALVAGLFSHCFDFKKGAAELAATP
jgi:hypothetical protein